MTLRDRVRDTITKVQKSCLGGAGEVYNIDQATDSILQAVREIVPEGKMPQGNGYHFIKGFNQAIDLINAEIGKGE